MNDWIVSYTRFVLRWRWAVVGVVVAVVMALGAGGQNLKFSNDYRYFFSESNPNLEAFEKLQRTYSSPDTLMWVIQPKDGKVTTPQILALLKEMTEAAWQTPYVLRVDSITNFQHTRAEEDDLTVQDLVLDPAKADPAMVEAIALAEPALAGRILSHDARTTAVVATLKMPQDDPVANTETATFGRQMRDDIAARYPDLTIKLTGTVMLSNSFNEAAIADLGTLTPLMYIALCLAVYFLLRSFSAVIATMLVIAFAAMSAMGSAGWLGFPLTPPSAGAPTVILTIAVADSIHILVTMLVEMRRGKNKEEAIVESMRVNFTPVFLTSITTAIGFLSLNFSDAPPIQDLGNMSAMGAVAAWIYSILFLPAIIDILPVKAKDSVVRQTDFMERFADGVIARRRPILWISTAAVIGLSALLPQLTFNDRFVEYFDGDSLTAETLDAVAGIGTGPSEFRRATDWAADHLTGVYVINYSLGAQDTNGIADPGYLKTLDAFANWFRAQDEVVHVSTLTDVFKRVNKSMHGDNPDYYRLPEGREEAAQYLLLYEMSLPYGLDLNDQINVDKSATRLMVTMEDLSTAELRVLQNKAQAWLDENAPKHMHSHASGQMVMFSFIGESNLGRMTSGTAVALILISACLMLALRNLKLGLVSLVPNLTPPLVAFGILTLFTTEVGFWATFVIATALGLIVDATVHFLSKYQRARVEFNKSAEDSVRYSMGTVGTALWVSTFVLVLGFAILALSPFRVNEMLGTMVALTIAVALVLDFLLLPALLLTIDGKAKSDAPGAAQSAPAE